MGRYNWKWIGIGSLIFLFFVFTLQNYRAVDIRFLFWGFSTSQAIIIYAMLLTGFIGGWFLRRHFKE